MIRLGIVGWGYWGRNYAKYLDTTIDASLSWVCDTRDEMLKNAKKRYPHFKVTKNYQDLVRNSLDGVIIATPASTHYMLSKYFIENRMNILVEKPLTNSILTSVDLLSLSKKYNVKVLVGHTFIYNQSVRWIKEKIDKKYFGKIYYLEFKRQSYGPIRDDVNIIWDFAPHDLSITSWFLKGQYPLSVFAKGKKFSRNSQEDIAVITLEYPHDVLVNINVGWLYPIKIRMLVLLGNKRMAVFDDTNNVEPLRIYNTTIQYPSEKDPYGAAFRLGDVLIPRIQPVDPLYTQIKHFVDCIKGLTEPVTGIDEGIKNVALLAAINESLRKKEEIDFKRWLNQFF